ncbi:endolytic transglycosylase MltG [Cellulomonas sp. P22]|uniref:endolytic transglycosylase MltG n=1 Tax=Cellulomonas sp. P22 TaxID=3373189 RepID=UPI0037AFFBFB
MSDLFLGTLSQHEGEPPVPSRRSRSARDNKAHRSRQRRNRRRRSFLVVILALALVVGGGYVVKEFVGGLFSGGEQTVTDYPGPGHDSAQVVINAGDTGSAMGSTLVDARVVATVKAFTAAFAANPVAASIQPGTYQLRLEMRAADAVEALLDPTNLVSTKVTIPEGFTAEKIFARLSEQTGIAVEEFEAAAADPAAIGLPPEAGGEVEGWLSPLTYTIAPDESAAAILSTMVAGTVRTLDDLGVPAADRQTVLIKASITEQEVSFTEEYAKVVRVVDNRLATGMPLGMDTINAYGLGKSAMDLVASDFAVDNPYNARMHTGLPPTPIGNPGAEAINAALHPADGDWLYFITVDLDSGETKFTSSYDEFLVYKAQYQQWLAANR